MVSIHDDMTVVVKSPRHPGAHHPKQSFNASKSLLKKFRIEQTVTLIIQSISERPNLHFVGSAEPMPNHDLSGRTDTEPMPNLNQ